MSPIVLVLAGILPWLVLFGGAVYLIRLSKRPGPDALDRAEVQDLREQVALMRDFLRDAMERLNRLEERVEEEGRLGPGEGGGSDHRPGDRIPPP